MYWNEAKKLYCSINLISSPFLDLTLSPSPFVNFALDVNSPN